MEIICSFRLVLEEKTGKEIAELSRLRVLRKVFRKQFCFIKYRRQHLWGIQYRKSSKFTFVENTIGNSPKVTRGKFLGTNGLFCFLSKCKFRSFKNLFQPLLACLNFTLDS